MAEFRRFQATRTEMVGKLGLRRLTLSFCLAIAPRGCESSADRAAISFQSGDECFHSEHARYTGLRKPGLQLSLGRVGVGLIAGVAGAHEGSELACQFRGGSSLRVLPNARNDRGVSWCQFCRRLHE